MLYTDAADIDFNRYDRLFVIGCSFTHWLWPTWADIIAREHQHLEYHNFGVPGASNEYIQTMLSQITRKYALSEKDIVLIMWSSFHRYSVYNLYSNINEFADCVIKNQPITEVDYTVFNWHSSIDMIGMQLTQLTQHTATTGDYENYINDGRGYLIKNLAVLDTVKDILTHSKYHSAQMMSTGISNQREFDSTCLEYPKKDVLDLYKDIESYMLGEACYDLNGYTHKQVMWDDGGQDYHPRSIQYYNYLKYLNFDISETSKLWCIECDSVVDSAANVADLTSIPEWPYTEYPQNKEFPL